MSLLPRPPEELNEAAVWQDVEFGSYAADLPLWEELADEAEGPVVELGSGSGRVAVHLARAGYEVVAVERDAGLAEELGRRAADQGLAVRAMAADIAAAEGLGLSGVALVIAPLQVMQLLGEDERGLALGAIAEALEPGGRCAASLVDETTLVEQGVAATSPPDMREIEGWVYSSEPLWVQVSEASLRMRRLRERVSPRGDVVRKVHDDLLHRLAPEGLEREAGAAGLRPVERRPIASSAYEAGSVAVILEAP